MNPHIVPWRTALPVLVLTATLFICASPGCAADPYDAAVAHAGRSAADVKRDALEHPAAILRLTGIKAGMRVAECWRVTATTASC